MNVYKGTLNTNGLEEAFELSFDNAEINALSVYVADIDILLKRSFLHSPDNFHLRLSATELQTAQPKLLVLNGEFDDEQWSAFLHRFRPLAGLKKDKHLYGFLKIRRLVERRAVPNKRLCNFLHQMLEQFQLKQMPLQITFGINGNQHDLEDTFSIWMNAMEFHRDSDKRDTISKISKFLPESGIRALMANIAVEKLGAMHELRRFIGLLLSPPGVEVPLWSQTKRTQS